MHTYIIYMCTCMVLVLTACNLYKESVTSIF